MCIGSCVRLPLGFIYFTVLSILSKIKKMVKKVIIGIVVSGIFRHVSVIELEKTKTIRLKKKLPFSRSFLKSDARTKSASAIYALAVFVLVSYLNSLSSFRSSRTRFSKAPKRFRPRTAIRKKMNHSFDKAIILACLEDKKFLTNSKVS